jgi:hypothetical protein
MEYYEEKKLSYILKSDFWLQFHNIIKVCKSTDL